MSNFWTNKDIYNYLWLNSGMTVLLVMQLTRSDVLHLIVVLTLIVLGTMIIRFADSLYRLLASKHFHLDSGDIALYKDAKQVLPLCVIRGTKLILFKRYKPHQIDLSKVRKLSLSDNASRAIKIVEAKSDLRLEFEIDAGVEQNRKLFQIISERIQQVD